MYFNIVCPYDQCFSLLSMLSLDKSEQKLPHIRVNIWQWLLTWREVSRMQHQCMGHITTNTSSYTWTLLCYVHGCADADEPFDMKPERHNKWDETVLIFYWSKASFDWLLFIDELNAQTLFFLRGVSASKQIHRSLMLSVLSYFILSIHRHHIHVESSLEFHW